MDNVPAPAYYAVTSYDHAAWVVATSLIFLIYSIIAVVAKILLRVNITTMKVPDICLVACLFLLLVQTTMVVCACNAGLGKHLEALTDTAYSSYSKYYYASSLLAIVIQAGTKLSICLLISAISPQRRLLLANRASMALITVWAVSGIFATAFQCNIPNPWNTLEDQSCTSIKAIYFYNGFMNILTDLIICTLPVVMMWKVKTTRNKKLQVCVLFGARILVPAVTVPTLATSHIYFNNIQTDPTWNAVLPAILGQISVNLSVLTACLPGLKSVLDNLLSGTANARLRGAYQLTNSGDKKTRLTVTPWGSHGGSKTFVGGTKPASKTKSSSSEPKSIHDSSSHTFSITGGIKNAMMSGARHKTSTSESTHQLNEGVILRTDDYDVSSIQNPSRSHTENTISPGDDVR